MQYVAFSHTITFISVASNDNDDLLSFAIPSIDLSLIRDIKRDLREENAQTGILLSSVKARRFFEEVMAAEKYIMLRYFTPNSCENTVRALKRHILDHYLFPKNKRSRKKSSKPKK